MNKKINAYYKIHRAINSSKHELHLHTCSIMLSVFNLRYQDSSMVTLLQDQMDMAKSRMSQPQFNRM